MAGVFNDPCGSAYQIFNATSTKICFEDLVGVIQVTDDQIEAREIPGQFRRQFRIAREKSRQQSVFDRLHCLCIEPILREHCNVLVPENLDVRVRPRVAKCFERWQSENVAKTWPI